MKKFSYFLIASILMLLSGCQSEELANQQIPIGNHSLVATIEGQDYIDASRTAVDDSGNVTWITTDELGVYGNVSENVKYSSTGNGSDVTFTGDLPETEEAKWAYYPYDKNASLTESKLTITLLDNYTYTGNSNAPMLGKSVGNNKFSFKHLGGLIRFTLGGGIPDDADRFVITSVEDNQPIAGLASFPIEGENVTMSVTDNGKQSISYDVSTIKDAEEFQHFFVPLPVGDYTKLQVSFYKKNSETPVFTRSLSNLKVGRAEMICMPILNWNTGEQFILNEATKDLSASMTEEITVSLENNTTLEYKNVEEGNEPKVGEIVWSRVSDDFPNGFLGKVSKVTKNNDGSYSVETEAASLSEAFDMLYVDETVSLESDELVSRAAEGSTDVFGFDITSTVSFSTGMENPPIEVEGSFETGRKFQVSIMLDKKKKIEQAMITFIDACKLSFSLSAEGTFAEYESKQKLGEIKFKSIPVAYGIIQLRPTITPHFILEANGEICNTASFCQEFVSYTGAEFKNGKWTAGQNRRNKVQGDSPWNFEGELTFSGSLSAGISSDFEVELYGRDDAQVSFAPKISSQLAGEIKIDESNSTSLENIIESLKLDASIQFEATVEIDASLLSPTDNLKAEFTLAKVTLAEKELYLVPFFEELLADLHTDEYAESENNLLAHVSTSVVGEMLSKETEVSIVVEDPEGNIVQESQPVVYTGAPKEEVIEEGDTSPKSEPKSIGTFAENLSQKKEYKAYPVIQSPILEKIVPEGKLVLKDLSVLFKGSGSLREKLIHLYKNAGGDNWTHNENWCSNLPIDTWRGVYKDENNKYFIKLDNNNLVGTFALNDSLISRIRLYNNPGLTGINVAECTSLTELDYDRHVITSLDVSDCNALLESGNWNINELGTTGGSGYNCALTSLSARNLHSVTVFHNMYTNWDLLDLSGCENLESFGREFQNPHIGTLKLAGCKKLTSENFYLGECPDILDISGCNGMEGGYGKKELYAKGNTTLKNAWVQGSDDDVKCDVSGCESLETLFTEGAYSMLNIEGCINLSTLECKIDSKISLNNNTKLKSLTLVDGSTGGLNLSECNELEELVLGNIASDADSITLTELALPYNSSLKSIVAYNTNLSSLDISRSYELEKIQFTRSKISEPMELDVTQHKSLKSISLAGKYQVTSLNARGCTNLESVYIHSSVSTTVDLSDCNKLKYLTCSVDGPLDLHDCTNLSSLYCSGSKMTSLNISGLTQIESFSLMDSQLTSIDFSNCKNLKTLKICYTPLISLDLSGLSALKEFDCYENNNLSSLNLTGCASMETFECYQNGNLSTLNLTGCTSLKKWWCYENSQLENLTLMSSAPLSKSTKLDFSNTKISNEIPDYFLKYPNSAEVSPTFVFDFNYVQRYTDYKKIWDSANGKWVTTYTDNGYGWWFPGEPESGKHGKSFN